MVMRIQNYKYLMIVYNQQILSNGKVFHI
jgi:hypothetical protein